MNPLIISCHKRHDSVDLQTILEYSHERNYQKLFALLEELEKKPVSN